MARDDADRRLQETKSASAERELEWQRRLTELESRRAAADQRLDGATSEIERRAADVRALTEVLAQREDTFRTAIDAQTEAHRVVARLEGELAAAHARHADAQVAAGRLEAVESQLDEARGQLEEARRRVAERDTIVGRLSDAIEHAQSERDAAAERLRVAEEEVAEADRAGADLEAELDRVSAELEQLRSADEERIAVSADATHLVERAESRVVEALAERDLQMARADELREKLEQLQSLADRTPEVERKAAELLTSSRARALSGGTLRGSTRNRLHANVRSATGSSSSATVSRNAWRPHSPPSTRRACRGPESRGGSPGGRARSTARRVAHRARRAAGPRGACGGAP